MNYCAVPITHTIKLGELAERINSFKESRSTLKCTEYGRSLN